jgi:hypothetical protein
MANEFRLDGVVLWASDADEYEAFLALADVPHDARLLDCGGGPSSFTAQGCARGRSAVAADPLYAFDAGAGHARFVADRAASPERYLAASLPVLRSRATRSTSCSARTCCSCTAPTSRSRRMSSHCARCRVSAASCARTRSWTWTARRRATSDPRWTRCATRRTQSELPYPSSSAAGRHRCYGFAGTGDCAAGTLTTERRARPCDG